MTPLMYGFLSVGLISLVSFVGAASLAIGRKWLSSILILLVSFAAGSLFGDVFIHLLPEAFEAHDSSLTPSLLILGGIILFFILEKFIRWNHCHNLEDDHEHRHHTLANVNLIGDGLHNFIDGLLIAASYLVSIPVGIATTVAVVLHEIPTEIGDFAVLLHSGLPTKRALLYNFYTALWAVAGAGVVFTLGASLQGLEAYLLPVTAGAFIYIAGSDLIPELHHHNTKLNQAVWQLVSLIAGIGVMVALTFIE